MSGRTFIGLLADRLYVGAIAVLVGVCLVAIAASALGGDSPVRTSRPPAADANATTATPAAAPTPELWEQLLDARRMLDLSTLAGALSAYHLRYGAYPSTGGGTGALCQAGTEPGCKLSAVKPGLSFGDGVYAYLYRSDGATYTLYARVQSPVTPDGCAAEHPVQLASLPVVCRTSAGAP